MGTFEKMTPKERARHASRGVGCGRALSDEDVEVLREFIEIEIVAAIEDEREASAKIMDDWAEVNMKHDRNYEAKILKAGAGAIRARGKGNHENHF